MTTAGKLSRAFISGVDGAVDVVGGVTTAGQLRRAGVYVPPHIPDHETVDAIHFTASGVVQPGLEELIARAAESAVARVVEKLEAPKRTPDVLTRTEAKDYVKRSSDMAFSRWCKRWKVKPAARGRYGRAALDLALEREGGLAHTPATLRAHQESHDAQERARREAA